MAEPPQLFSPEAEEAVIGSVLIHPGMFPALSLQAQHFHIHKIRFVWEAFARLYQAGKPIDMVTVSDELEDAGKLAEIGGPAFLTSLTNRTPTSLNAPAYAQIIREFAHRRKLLRSASELAKAAQDLDASPNGRVSEIVDRLAPDRDDTRCQVHTAAEALAPQPPVDWIIERLFSARSVSLVVGSPGSKKTYGMLTAAVCVALGKTWLGFATRRAKTLFVDEESGSRRMARRLGEVLRGEFGDESTPVEYVSLAQFNLREVADAVLMQALIEQAGAELVVIDALADIMPGADENMVRDVHPVFMRLRKIAEETGSALVVIHHSNKLGDYRGSTAISGAVDLLLMVESKEGSDFINFDTRKVRDVEPFKFAAQIHFNDGQVWLTAADQPGGRLTDGERWVIHYLEEHGPSTRTEIITEPDWCGSRAAKDGLYSLAKKDIIRRTNPEQRGRGSEAIYDLAPAGDQSE